MNGGGSLGLLLGWDYGYGVDQTKRLIDAQRSARQEQYVLVGTFEALATANLLQVAIHCTCCWAVMKGH